MGRVYTPQAVYVHCNIYRMYMIVNQMSSATTCQASLSRCNHVVSAYSGQVTMRF